MEYTSRVPCVTIRPVFAPLRSIKVFMAVVEPWINSPISAGSTPLMRRQSMIPLTSWVGVVRLLAWANRPVASSKAIKSVKVPPISIATSNRSALLGMLRTVSCSNEQSRRQASLSLVPGECAVLALSRRGMGRAGPRRQAALRVPGTGRRPGGAFLVEDPQQAPQIRQGLRTVRPRKGRALRRARREEIDGRCRNRTQPPQDRIRDRKRPRLSRSQEGIPLVRCLSLGFRGRTSAAKSQAQHEAGARLHAALGRDQQGPETSRLPFRRLDHRVRHYAGGGNGQRSFGLLFPAPAARSPKTAFFG